MQLTHTRETLKLAKDLGYSCDESLNVIEAEVSQTEAKINKLSKKDSVWYINRLYTQILLALLDTERTTHRLLLIRSFKLSTKADAARLK